MLNIFTCLRLFQFSVKLSRTEHLSNNSRRYKMLIAVMQLHTLSTSHNVPISNRSMCDKVLKAGFDKDLI